MHRSSLAACLCLAFVARSAVAQDTPRALTLEDALALAQHSNPGLAAARKRVEETQRHSSVAFSNFLPQLRTMAMGLASDNTRGILLPQGSLGYVPELGSAFPRTDRTIPQGGPNLLFALTTLGQPLTQYYKIREGLAVARADEAGGRAGLRRAEQEVSLGVQKAYGAVLIAAQRRDVARERIAAAELRVSEQTSAVQAGTANEIAAQEARVRLLQNRQELNEAEGQVDDMTYALVDAIGLPAGTPLALAAPPAVAAKPAPVGEYVASALRLNPDMQEAQAMVDKGTHGVSAAKAQRIPDLSLVAMHLYQSSVPFFPHSTFAAGLQGSWTILDFGARENTVQERQAQLSQADFNLEVVRGRVRGAVEAAYRKVTRASETMALASEGLALGIEAARLRTSRSAAGYGVAAEVREANADRLDAGMNLMKAEWAYRIALADLERVAGTLIP